MEPYRVNLPVYNGPLDLLLYLIRREEVDIYDIPVARVTQHYCAYVELMQHVDPNLAGEFLVMAATLLEIKSRMLLPTPPPDEAGDAESVVDPRADLVRQLLEYKAFKDAADELRQAASMQSMRHPRKPVRPEFERPELDLDDIQVWQLLDAFNSLMSAIGRTRAAHEVIYDDTPISLHADDIMDRLRRDGNMRFTEIFAGRTDRSEVIGLFLAMLELIRQKDINVQQEKNFGEIYVSIRTDVESDEPEPDEQEEAMIARNDDHRDDGEEAASQDTFTAAGARLAGLDGAGSAAPADDDEQQVADLVADRAERNTGAATADIDDEFDDDDEFDGDEDDEFDDDEDGEFDEEDEDEDEDARP